MYVSKIEYSVPERVKICSMEELPAVPALTLSVPFIALLTVQQFRDLPTTDSFIKEQRSQPTPIIT